MLSENKQQNSLAEVNKSNGGFTVSDVSVFKDSPTTLYLFQKTEKLVSAIYLISNFIKDIEPLKWQLREAGLNLISLSVKNGFEVSKYLKVISLLQIAHIAGIISEMNFNILKFEFESLIQTIEENDKKTGSKGLLFSEHFFAVSNQGETLNQEKGFTLIPNNYSKGHNTMSDRFTRPIGGMSNRQKPVRQVNPGGDKSNRQEIIIGLLKNGGELGIKDFTSAIKGCSEKTVQRELSVLVSKGQIKKAGEKRWSRYSING